MEIKPFEMVDREMAAILAEKSSRERLEIAFGMWRSARNMLLCIVRAEHPDWPEREVELEAGRRLLSGTD
ncbi:MAG: hypothetical protein KF708_05010 [Pirellulales bacterium]|nr:hypothetical protein [Pirellulales bacterium]